MTKYSNLDPAFRKTPRWGVTWIRGKSGMQDAVLSELQDGERIVKTWTNEILGWGATKDIETLIKGEHGIYEIIPENTPRRVYFDIDAYNPAFDVLEKAKSLIVAVFPNAEFAISGSVHMITDADSDHSGETKHSYHIVLPNWFCKTKNDMFLVKMFVEQTNTLHQTSHGSDLFDKNVYGKNQCLKCVNQSKKYKQVENRRIQNIIENDNVMDHIVTAPFNWDASEMIHISKCLIKKTMLHKDEKGITRISVLPDVKDYKRTLRSTFDYETAKPIDVLNIIPNETKGNKGELNFNIIFRIMIWARSNGIQWSDFWRWNQQRGNTTKRYEHYKQIWESVEGDDKYVVETDNFIRDIVEHYFKNATKPIYSEQFRKSFNYPADNMINEKRDLQLDDIITDKKYIILNTPMGSRKTGVAIDAINHYGYERILFFSARITLSKNVIARLKSADIDVKNYKEISGYQKKKGELRNVDKLIISPESLHYVDGCEYDLIIMDESETVLNTFGGECATHGGNLNKNWSALKTVIKAAKKCIFMDAFTSSITRDFIERIETPDNVKSLNPVKPYYFVDMVKPIDLKQIIIYKSEDKITKSSRAHWHVKLAQEVKAGKKVFIFDPLKNHQPIIDTLINNGGLKSDQIIDYFGDSTNKSTLTNVNDVWSDDNIRAVITNSCITVGVNYDMPDVFDCIFAGYSRYIGGRDFTQAMMRIRQTKTKTIHFHEIPTKYEASYIKPSEEPGCHIWNSLRANLMRESKYKALPSSNGAIGSLKLFFDQAGFSIKLTETVKDSVELQEINNAITHATSIYDYDAIPTILSTDNYNVDEIALEVHNEECPLIEKLTYQKYLFTRFFNDDVLDTPEIAYLWNKKYIQVVDKFRTLKLNPDHWLNQFYRDNVMDYCDEVPDEPKWTIDIPTLTKEIVFKHCPKKGSRHLISNVLNVFWGKKVYSISKDETGKPIQRKINGKASDIYETDSEFMENMEFIIAHTKTETENAST